MDQRYVSESSPQIKAVNVKEEKDSWDLDLSDTGDGEGWVDLRWYFGGEGTIGLADGLMERVKGRDAHI